MVDTMEDHSSNRLYYIPAFNPGVILANPGVILAHIRLMIFQGISAVIYVYVIARAGVIFGIYFTSCRYSGG